MTTFDRAAVAKVVDEFNKVSAQIAALEEQREAFRKIFITLYKNGAGDAFESEIHRTTVSSHTRTSHKKPLKEAIAELVAEHLSYQFVAANTVKTTVYTVKPGTRNAINVDDVVQGLAVQHIVNLVHEQD